MPLVRRHRLHRNKALKLNSSEQLHGNKKLSHKLMFNMCSHPSLNFGFAHNRFHISELPIVVVPVQQMHKTPTSTLYLQAMQPLLPSSQFHNPAKPGISNSAFGATVSPPELLESKSSAIGSTSKQHTNT